MIFYFSGTGNSKWVANQIAQLLNSKTRNISEIEENEEVTFDKDEFVGIVFPVYAWSYPEHIERFLNKIKINNSYVFAIANCAGDAGNSIKNINKIVKLNSGYSIAMPNNYLPYEPDNDKISEEYKKKNEKEIIEKIKSAQERIKYITDNIKERKNIFDVYTGKLAFFKSSFINRMFNKYARSTKKFTCNKTLCNSCGLCEKICPAKTIKIEEGIAKWGEACYQCYSCINRCPKEAINFSDSTKNKNRYYIEKYL